MEGKCQELFEKVAKIHDTAHVLAQVWDSRQITPDRKQESIDRLRERAVELKEKMSVRAWDANEFFNFLDWLENNKTVSAEKTALMKNVDKITTELAIHAIADCECARPIKPPASLSH